MRIAILGSGVWGCAYGRAIASPAHAVVFWDRHAAAAQQAAVAPHCAAAPTLAEAVDGADYIIIAVSSAAFADIARQTARVQMAGGGAGDPAPVLWLTKGFDPASGRPLYALAAEALPHGRYGAISGPSFAHEVARGQPAALSLAASAAATAAAAQAALHRPRLRLYVQDDLIGVCIGGAIKNIIAIAAGLSDGLQQGENARAALVSRGLEEMAALTDALDGKRDTLLGLCGIGDLALTCASPQSRNYRLGVALATGAPAAQDTTEGAPAAAAAAKLARQYNLQTPIIAAVDAVLAGQQTPAAAAAALLARPPRA